MNFVKLTEENGWENETWDFFLQYEGNEEALKKLQGYITAYFDGDGDVNFSFDPTLVPESEVDVLVKHSPSGYMSAFNKVTGKLTVPDWEDKDGMEGWEVAQDALYKGGIEKLFHEA